MTAVAPQSGLLLVGHGTRSAAGRAEFVQTAEMVAVALSEVPVAHCFLELAEPTIAEGVARLAEQRVQEIVVAPLMLFAAGHAKRDIPESVSEAVQAYPKLSVRQTPHLGCDERILKLSALRYREALGDAAEETALVLVGRGSLDAEATIEMRRFTELRVEITPVGTAFTCFLAMAEPRLEMMLTQVAEQGWRRIVVQPHLLFQGDLLDGLQSAVAAARQRWPDREWRLTEHLGPAPLLVECIVEKYRELRGRSR